MEDRSLIFDPQQLRYAAIIGTGGIGSGKFFKMNGDHTLGREESRSGHFLDIDDYCKQHIILHYTKVLLGPFFRVIPIGKIGDDDTGKVLYNEMRETGFVMDHIKMLPDVSTLFSFCFYYPDGSGGNMTTDNSASSLVDTDFIDTAEIQKHGSGGIILAVPEVPLGARHRLLELGKQEGMYCTASFTTEEIPEVLDSGILEIVDLIAINIDEASAIVGNKIDSMDSPDIVEQAIKKLQIHNRNILVSVTAGKQGSWCWDGSALTPFPAIVTEAVSTAGAGDAFFSGLICGLALGFHIFDAQQLASLIAGMSVTSPHTIHKGVNRDSLYEFMQKSGFTFSEKITKLFLV